MIEKRKPAVLDSAFQVTSRTTCSHVTPCKSFSRWRVLITGMCGRLLHAARMRLVLHLLLGHDWAAKEGPEAHCELALCTHAKGITGLS